MGVLHFVPQFEANSHAAAAARNVLSLWQFAARIVVGWKDFCDQQAIGNDRCALRFGFLIERLPWAQSSHRLRPDLHALSRLLQHGIRRFNLRKQMSWNGRQQSARRRQLPDLRRRQIVRRLDFSVLSGMQRICSVSATRW